MVQLLVMRIVYVVVVVQPPLASSTNMHCVLHFCGCKQSAHMRTMQGWQLLLACFSAP